MAIERDINKKKPKDKPAQQLIPMKPFGKKGKSPTYTKRNPHRDSGDKKPSLKTKASIIKEKAKKGQGLKRGGVAKALGVFPFIGRSVRQKGTISTIEALKPIPFVGKPLKKAMGGQASESVARSKILKDMRDRKRVGMMGMLDRLYGKQKIKPKKKPKKK